MCSRLHLVWPSLLPGQGLERVAMVTTPVSYMECSDQPTAAILLALDLLCCVTGVVSCGLGNPWRF